MPSIKERVQKTGKHCDEEINLGSDYTEEEIEFMKAIEAYKAKTGRKFPTWCETLAVARSLGYRKAAPPKQIQFPIQISYFTE